MWCLKLIIKLTIFLSLFYLPISLVQENKYKLTLHRVVDTSVKFIFHVDGSFIKDSCYGGWGYVVHSSNCVLFNVGSYAANKMTNHES